MGNDMFNEEQLAYAAEQQASRERNSPPAYILSREAFLRKLHILADTRPSNDGPIPSEVDLSAHDAAIRAVTATLAEIIEEGRRLHAEAVSLQGMAAYMRWLGDHGPRLLAVAEVAVEMREALRTGRNYIAAVHGQVAGASGMTDNVVSPDLVKIDRACEAFGAAARGEK